MEANTDYKMILEIQVISSRCSFFVVRFRGSLLILKEESFLFYENCNFHLSEGGIVNRVLETV